MYYISTSSNRSSKSWKNQKLSWEDFIKLIQLKTVKTNETHQEYLEMEKEDQDKIKDVGGFVGGWCKHGRRLKQNIQKRKLISLDFDNCCPNHGLMDLLEVVDCNYLVHSTHKHGDEAPRLRVIIPVSRELTNVEYEFISREIADLLGFEMLDITSFQMERLMYFPSHSFDTTPILEYITSCKPLQVDEWLDLDRVLDRSTWKYGPQEKKEKHIAGESQEDPFDKKGLIGAWCKSWPISRVLEELFTGEYEKVNDDRWTLCSGSTSGGVLVYDDKWYYSYHSTDEEQGLLLNSYDLVRLKKFKGNKIKCHNFMNKDKATRIELNKEEFGDSYKDWMKELEWTRQGNCKDTYHNIGLILTNRHQIKYNEFGKLIVIDGVNLDNRKLAQTQCMLETEFGLKCTKEKIGDTMLVKGETFHPVKKYLEGLKWDGVNKLDTFISTIFGIQSSPYLETITRKFFCACVKRIYEPGCKFDHVLTLVGIEDLGKSFFGDIMCGGEWFTDDVKLSDMRDKTGSEKLNGYWIVELSELAGRSKAEDECVTSFISRKKDNYRPAFGRVNEEFLRSCCFIATTNKMDGFLTKDTGNRRWWIVNLSNSPGVDFEKLKDMRDSIWAECMSKYKQEKLYLTTQETKKEAKLLQLKYLEHYEDIELIQEYLSCPIPDCFNKLSIYERRDYIQNAMGIINSFDKESKKYNLVKRTDVCCSEVFYELYGKDINKKTKRDMNNISIALRKLGWEQTTKRSPISAYGRGRLFCKL
jgi:predicted P-loop ATPase